jgi:tetratricopeptide (TPR) repeat protein
VDTVADNQGKLWLAALNRLALTAAVLLIGGFFSACQMNLKTSTEYLISGNEYFKAGDYQNAEKDYRTALKLDPSSATAQNNLGVILNEEGRYDEAIEVLREAIHADSKNAIAHYVLARSLTKKGLFDDAIIEAQLATELDKTEPAAYKALAEAALAKGAADVAINAYRCSVRLDPENDEYHHELEDIDGQIAEEKKCLELNPENKEATSALREALQKKGVSEETTPEVHAHSSASTVSSPKVSDARLRLVKTPH